MLEAQTVSAAKVEVASYAVWLKSSLIQTVAVE